MSYPHSTSSTYPPTSLRPTNISQRPDLNGTIYVETARAMPPPSEIPQRASSSSSQQTPGTPQSSGQPNMSDIAGVLRRNQACLNCRRRKLKCDAVRPHCGTCVRSHKHHLKSSPNNPPALNCEYDDGSGAGPGNGFAGAEVDHRGSPLEAGDDDGESAKKRKKRSTGENKRRSRKDEEDEETDRLRRKIEALEAQLANSHGARMVSTNDLSGPEQPWANSASAFGSSNISAPSPTAFLEMLSSAATAQADSGDAMSNVPGLRVGAPDNTMMSSVYASTPTDINNVSTGLTPFLSFVDNQEAQLASEAQPPLSNTNQSINDESRRSSEGTLPTMPNPSEPKSFFHFGVGTASISGHDSVSNIQWPPPLGPDGQLQPSMAREGPWRGVETATSGFQPQNDIDITMQDPAPVPDQSASELNEAIQQQLLLDLFWPGWPQYLPEPNIVNDLVEAFFDLVPNMSRLLHRSRFLARLTLPPTHSNFPHPALIHAVCAAAASWCAPAVYERSTRAQWTDNPWANDKSMTFALRQAAFGKDAVQDGLNTGNRLFDVVRAMIILSRVFIDDTRMLECWAFCGLVSRMILPLGLNVRSAELSLKSVMLPPPADAVEREERRITVWMALYHETVASAASGWGTSISLEELTVPLPVSAQEFEEGHESMPPNPQDLDSTDFWTRHPVSDPFVMVTKAVVLLNRVNRFVRKWKNRHLREDDDFDGMQRPEFRELANAAACLQMSFPAALRNPAKLNNKKKLDIDLIAAHMIPHAAIICLYEPFADVTDPNDGPARRILSAAQSIVSIIQQLAMIASNDGVSNLANVMHSSASVCLVTSARTSLLFYRLALNQQDPVTAESHRMDIEMIRTSLQAFGQRFKIGHHHSQLIEYFLDRASRPDYQKLQAHYPTHPRPGAPELHPQADFGQCILNALNIKRGFWRKWGDIAGNVGLSPIGSTPESAAYASSAAGLGSTTTGSATGSATDRSANITRISSDSPHANGTTYGGGISSSGNGVNFGCPVSQAQNGQKAPGSINAIDSNENSPTQWTNILNTNSNNTSVTPTDRKSSTDPIAAPVEQGKAYNIMGTHPVAGAGGYSSTTSAASILEFYNANSATQAVHGAVATGLTKEHEALFDGIKDPRNEQKHGTTWFGGVVPGLQVPQA